MNDADGIRVRYERVQNIADNIRQVSNQIRRDMDRMDDAVKVVADTWDGEAHRMYLDVQRAYKARANHMHQVLADVAKMIENGKDSFRNVDLKNMAAIERALG